MVNEKNNKMKKIILTIYLLGCGVAYSQYSSYYNMTSNVKVEANLNQNVSGSIYEYKTIRSIDYGTLELANAQREKNRIELQKFQDEQQKEIALQIVANPIKAYDYGNWYTISTKDKSWKKTPEGKEALKDIVKSTGFKEFSIQYVVPNIQIFTMLTPAKLQNVSTDGVTTDVIIYLPTYKKDTIEFDIEQDFDSVIVGKEIEQLDERNKISKIFYLKKELNRATIYGNKGFRTTYIWEDKYESCITDNYIFYYEDFKNGCTLGFKVRYYGNKTEVDFEKLEGRRFYLKPLIEKLISTAKVSELEVSKK